MCEVDCVVFDYMIEYGVVWYDDWCDGCVCVLLLCVE